MNRKAQLATPEHGWGLSLFEDEVSFAQWGSLRYTWARRGQQPKVSTSGKRKGYKVFGAITYFSGRLFSQGIEGRFTSESYQEFLQTILAYTTELLFLIHDGTRYHSSQATQQFLPRMPTASRGIRCRRIRRTIIRLNTYGRRRNSRRRTTSTSRSLRR